MAKNYLVTISYDGNYFNGWAKQPDLITVQGELERHLSFMCQEKIFVIGSGRTDRYVHAIKQYFNFQTKHDLPESGIMEYLNQKSKFWIIKEVKNVSLEFSARFDAKQKIYHYKILKNYDSNLEVFLNNYYLIYKFQINWELIKKASDFLIGTHDFASFSARENYSNSERTLQEINFIEEENILIIELKGTGFLRFMVRNIVGSLLALNENQITYEEFINYILKPKKGKVMYKQKGNSLYLFNVIY